MGIPGYDEPKTSGYQYLPLFWFSTTELEQNRIMRNGEDWDKLLQINIQPIVFKNLDKDVPSAWLYAAVYIASQ